MDKLWVVKQLAQPARFGTGLPVRCADMAIMADTRTSPLERQRGGRIPKSVVAELGVAQTHFEPARLVIVHREAAVREGMDRPRSALAGVQPSGEGVVLVST